MQSFSFKLVGIALGIAALAAFVGSIMPVGTSGLSQRERILKSAQAPGASKVRIRAAEAELRRPPPGESVSNQPPAIIVPETPSEEGDPDQPQSGGYSGSAPVPQIVFAEDPQPQTGTTDAFDPEPQGEE